MTFFRCFELNEFSGVNFVSSPCRFLKTLENTFSAVESSDQIVLDVKTVPSITRAFSAINPADQIVKKSAVPETEENVMSTFQNAVQNCCSDINSNTAYR